MNQERPGEGWAMGKTTCPVCWTSFEGRSCPVCARKKEIRQQTEAIERIGEETKRQLEETRAAIEEEGLRSRMAAADAVEQHRKIEAESWKLEAHSMSERGYELYRAGMYDDAVDLASKAIKKDPGNIYPYMYAAWARDKQGAASEARSLYEKQITLLGLSENRQNPRMAEAVLSGLPRDEALSNAFCNVVRDTSRAWRFTDCFSLLNAMIECRLWTHVRDLLMAFLSREESLLIYAYLFEVTSRLGIASEEGLTAFLQNIPSGERSGLLRDFEFLTKSPGILSEVTVTLVRKRLAERYEEWRPEIHQTLVAEASKLADQQTAENPLLKWAWWVIAGVWLGPHGTAVVLVQLLRPEQLNKLNNWTAGIPLFGGWIGAAILGRSIVKAGIRSTSYLRSLEALQAAEAKKWAEVGFIQDFMILPYP